VIFHKGQHVFCGYLGGGSVTIEKRTLGNAMGCNYAVVASTETEVIAELRKLTDLEALEETRKTMESRSSKVAALQAKERELAEPKMVPA
jgi:hypothetical protein